MHCAKAGSRDSKWGRQWCGEEGRQKPLEVSHQWRAETHGASCCKHAHPSEQAPDVQGARNAGITGNNDPRRPEEVEMSELCTHKVHTLIKACISRISYSSPQFSQEFMFYVYCFLFSLLNSLSPLLCQLTKAETLGGKKMLFVSQSCLFPLDLKEHNGQSFMLLSRLYITLLCYRINPSLQLCVVTLKNKWRCGWTVRKEWSSSASPLLLLSPGELIQWAQISNWAFTAAANVPGF